VDPNQVIGQRKILSQERNALRNPLAPVIPRSIVKFTTTGNPALRLPETRATLVADND
jgi:hypothetical protein